MAKAPWNLSNLLATASDVVDGGVYPDDGTNTANGKPQLRVSDGVSWYDGGEATHFRKAVQIADATVANTVTETTLFGTLKSGDTLQFAANALVAGYTIRVRMAGIVSTTGSPTLNLIVKLGSVEIVSTGAITQSGLSTDSWVLQVDLTCRSVGASGTVQGAGVVSVDDSGSSSIVSLTRSGGVTTPATIDTTLAQTLNITATWGTASASNTITAQTAVVEVFV